jgi:hypothetical protein
MFFITGLGASLAFAPCLKRKIGKISGKAEPNRKHAPNEHLCLSGLLVCPAVLETLIPAVKPLYLKKLRTSQSTKGGNLIEERAVGQINSPHLLFFIHSGG